MEWLLLLGVLYIAYQSGALRGLGVGGPSAGVTLATPDQLRAQQAQINLNTVGGLPQQTGVYSVNGQSLGVQTGASVGIGAATAAMSAGTLGLSVGSAAVTGAATAGIGAAVTIFATLWAAHERRLQQARGENQAMNVGVQGFDQDIKLVNAQYNNGSIDAQTAIRALQQVLAQYWLLVGPQIQPGRNGCSSGETCPPPGSLSCSGNIGAACCVGCGSLTGSLYNPTWGAITILQMGGGVSTVEKVYGSSYGGQERNAYQLTWRQSGAY